MKLDLVYCFEFEFVEKFSMNKMLKEQQFEKLRLKYEEFREQQEKLVAEVEKDSRKGSRIAKALEIIAIFDNKELAEKLKEFDVKFSDNVPVRFP